jgi:hypothetical protein
VLSEVSERRQGTHGAQYPAMTDRYTHVEDGELHEAVARMGSATRTATGGQRLPEVIEEALANIVADQRNLSGPRRDRTCDPLIKRSHGGRYYVVPPAS